jgi:hypothetical protein
MLRSLRQVRARAMWMAAFASSIVVFAATGSAGTLDQSAGGPSEDPDAYLGDNYVQAQTFTAARPGSLDQVDLLLNRIGDPGPLIVEVRTTSGGVPTGTVLASETLDQSSIPALPSDSYTWVPVTLSPAAPSRPGIAYAVVVKAPDGVLFSTGYLHFYDWALASDAYAGGEALLIDTAANPASTTTLPRDHAFKTYVGAPSKSDCLKGGWQPIGFKNQGDCVSYVATQAKNKPS